MEHSCHICGLALSRVRAPLDPIYRLPVVVCPGCRAACLRRRHPLAVLWRSARHALATTIGLIWRVCGVALLVGVSIGVAEKLVDALNSVGPIELARLYLRGELDADWWRGFDTGIGGAFLIGMCLAWWFALGAALTAAFAHIRRRWIVWSAFAGVLFGALAMGDAFAFATRGWRQQQFDSSVPLAQIFWEFGRISGWLVVGLLVAVAGIPLGRALRRGLAQGEGKRWRARLRRARKRRIEA